MRRISVDEVPMLISIVLLKLSSVGAEFVSLDWDGSWENVPTLIVSGDVQEVTTLAHQQQEEWAPSGFRFEVEVRDAR